MNEYNSDFYLPRHQETKYAADKILSLVLSKAPNIKSAVDIGCGVGTWLATLKEKGIEEIFGYEGKWLDTSALVVPLECVQLVDLSQKLYLKRKYDLAISLEVAEHLPEELANDFVSTLVSASDYILFSAAIPHQGGNHHINEQWPQYWVDKFKQNGFIPFDFIRPHIFHDSKIPFWYQQNILFFANEKVSKNIAVPSEINVLNIVHPDLYLKKVNALNVGVLGSIKLFFKALKKYLKRKI